MGCVLLLSSLGLFSRSFAEYNAAVFPRSSGSSLIS